MSWVISLACAGFAPTKVLESEPSSKVCVYYWNAALCSPHIRFLGNDLGASLRFHLIEVKADFTQTRGENLQQDFSVCNLILGNLVFFFVVMVHILALAEPAKRAHGVILSISLMRWVVQKIESDYTPPLFRLTGPPLVELVCTQATWGRGWHTGAEY